MTVLTRFAAAVRRFIIQTFDALLDVEGAGAVAEALDDPEL